MTTRATPLLACLCALAFLATSPTVATAQDGPTSCTWAANGTATCSFGGCSAGETLSVAFEGTAPGGSVTATCGSATVSCTTGALRACSDSVRVAANSLTGTCTSTGLGVFTCLAAAV